MVRWFRIIKKQYFGFWALGILAFLLQEIPYLIMPLFRLETNPVMEMTETSAALDVIEKILGSLCVAVMIFIVHGDAKPFSVSTGREKLFFSAAAAILALNFLGWGLYFSGLRTVFVMMLFIVILPPLYYTAIGLWRRNHPLAVLGLAFLAVHFIHVYGNLKA